MGEGPLLFVPIGREEVRGKGKQHFGLHRVLRAAKRNAEMFGLFNGSGHKPDRLEALAVMEKLREARPYLFTVNMILRTLNWRICAT